jgi:hypothetical protein
MTAKANLPLAPWRRGLVRMALAGLLGGGVVLAPILARASDDLGATDGGTEDAAPTGIQPTTTPDNLGCSASGAPVRASAGGALAGMFGLLLAQGARSRRRRRLAASVLVLATLAAGSPARAQMPEQPPEQPPPPPPTSSPPPAVTPATAREPPPHIALYRPEGKRRHFVISYNPLTLLLARYGGNLEVMLASHHVLVGTAYYAYTHTNEDSNNIFRGIGGEVGYRFYFGKDGPRGLYLGPSFLIGHFDAIPQTGATVNYWNYGGALDIGYQALVADRVALGLGGGVQYTVPTADFPAQELPASIYAIRGVRPRLLLSLGVAF